MNAIPLWVETSVPMNFEEMSVDELWKLREEVSRVLEGKLNAEKKKLEQRLTHLAGTLERAEDKLKRRMYPKVFPKYRNPSNPSETWSGRGKQPAWVLTALEAGKTLGELAIEGQIDRSFELAGQT